MQALHEYIVEQKKAFNETFKTESGLELYGDKRFAANRLSNRIVKLLNVPLLKESILKPGYELMIDPTIYYEQTYEKTGKQDNVFIQDRKQGVYKISPEMIVLYRESPDAEWKGYGKNLLVEFLPEPEPEAISTHLVALPKKRTHQLGVAKVKYPNKGIIDEGVSVGDTVAIRVTDGRPENYGVSFYLDGKEYFWLTNREVLALITSTE